MMTHEQHAISTEEFVDVLTDALIDSTGPDWTCSDGAWAIVRQLASEGRITRILEAFDPPAEEYRVGPSIYNNMGACVEVKDRYDWRSIAHCWQFNEAKFIVRALNAYRDSDGTATAAANEDLPVPQDCQARAGTASPNDSQSLISRQP